MTTYALYQIILSKPIQLDFAPEYNISLDRAQEYFGLLFEKKCSLNIKMKDNKGYTPLTNTILENRDGIIVWRIHNELEKEIWKPNGKMTNGIPDYGVYSETSEPHSYVIINNKPNILYMAVEKSKTWRSNVNKVKEIVRENLSEILQKKYALDINIRELTMPSKIWDFAEAQCKDGNDSITNISIEILNPNRIVPNLRTKRENMPDLLRQMQDFAILTDALNMIVGANYNKILPCQLKDKVDNIANIARHCTQNEFTLTLTFEKYGQYKCDENVIAQFPMQDNIVNQFLLSNETEIFDECPIESWFVSSIEKLEKMNYGAEIKE